VGLEPTNLRAILMTTLRRFRQSTAVYQFRHTHITFIVTIQFVQRYVFGLYYC